jgi:hypothetical protein
MTNRHYKAGLIIHLRRLDELGQEPCGENQNQKSPESPRGI